MINEDQIPIISKEYQIEFDNLKSILDSLITELNKILDYNIHNIEMPISGRIKSEISLNRKYDELHFEIKSIKQIEDLIGVRIICLLLQDVESIVKKLKVKYPQYKKHYNPAEKGPKDRFNYSSNHIIIEKNDFYIEIQIRTLSQHSWAQVSRKFNYKNEVDVPEEITRPLFRSSAHLESVDLDLDNFVGARKKYLTSLTKQSIEEIFDSSLNFDTLKKTLSIKIPVKYKGDSDELLYFSLLRELRSLGIDTVKKLVELIDQELDSAEKLSQSISKNILKKIENGEDTGYDAEKIKEGIRFSYIGMVRTMYNNFKRRQNARS